MSRRVLEDGQGNTPAPRRDLYDIAVAALSLLTQLRTDVHALRLAIAGMDVIADSLWAQVSAALAAPFVLVNSGIKLGATAIRTLYATASSRMPTLDIQLTATVTELSMTVKQLTKKGCISNSKRIYFMQETDTYILNINDLIERFTRLRDDNANYPRTFCTIS